MEVVRRRLVERRYSPRTAEAYVYWIRRFIRHHNRRHPADMGEDEVRAFLSSLAPAVAASTQNQALGALTFLYEGVVGRPLARVDGITPARRPKRLPVVLTVREIRGILSYLNEPLRCMAAACACPSARRCA
jgi:integrase